jgi:hypothetical protein
MDERWVPWHRPETGTEPPPPPRVEHQPPHHRPIHNSILEALEALHNNLAVLFSLHKELHRMISEMDRRHAA